MAKVTLTPEQRKARLDAAGAQLEAAVSSIVTGGDWQRALSFAAQLHSYSARNTLMLAYQAAERGWDQLGYVAGFQTWLKLGRHVRKGEHGLAVLAPVKYRTTDESTGEDRWQVRGFRVEHVFADVQTDGDGEIPTRPAPRLLTGEGPEGLWDALASLVAARGFELALVPDLGSAKGATSFLTHAVRVLESLEPAARVKTLAHELAHVILHAERTGDPRGLIEAEAESAAYLVLDAFGVASGGYSFPYVATWSEGKQEVVTAALANAKIAAAAILAALDGAAEILTTSELVESGEPVAA